MYDNISIFIDRLSIDRWMDDIYDGWTQMDRQMVDE